MQLMFLYKSQKSTNMNRKIVLYVKFLNSLLHHTKLNMFWITNYLQWSRIMNFKWFLTPVKEALLEKNIKLSECKSMISFISCLSYFEYSLKLKLCIKIWDNALKSQPHRFMDSVKWHTEDSFKKQQWHKRQYQSLLVERR